MKKLILSLWLLAGQILAGDFSDGMRLYDVGKHKEAFTIWQQLADEGLAKAQHNLGVMYEKGLGVEKDEKQALNWFEKAAENGHAKARYILGNKYFSGKSGLKRDYDKAIHWWELASNQGSVSASYNLGVLYLYADDKYKDMAKAKKWLMFAAAKGHRKAKNELLKHGIDISSLEPKTATDSVKDKVDKKEPEASESELATNESVNTKPEIKVETAPKTKPGTKLVYYNSDKKSSNQTGDSKPSTKKENPDTTTKPKVEVEALKPGLKDIPKVVDRVENNDSAKAPKAKKPVATALKTAKKPDAKTKKTNKKAKANTKSVKPGKKPKAKKVKPKAKKVSWIKSQPTKYFTIQLGVTNSKRKALDFIKRHRFSGKAHFYKIKNKSLYKIITGSYSSNAKAQKAIRKLPYKLRKQGAWPKRFKVVHREMS